MADIRSQTQQKTSGLGSIAGGPAVERLKSEAKDYMSAQAERMLTGVGHKLGKSTARLTDIAEGKGPGLGKLALEGGKKLIGGKGKGPLGAVAGLGGGLKDTVKGVLPGGGGDEKGGKKAKGKPTVIMESVDVGVPLRTAYDQWTQYQEFSSFAKGVQNVEISEDTESDWQFKIFLSHRDNKATTTEQIPDERIAWTAEAKQGTTKGVITFHELGPNLTRLLLVMEYQPSGFVEKTGNLWRAQGRRARLDFKNFGRFITMNGEASGAWRGEIKDGEVTRSHEDAVAEEDEDGEQSGEEDSEQSAAEDVQPSEAYEDETDYGYEQEEPDESGADDEADDEEEPAADAGPDDEYPEGEGEAEYDEDEAYETAGYADDEGEEADEDERAAPRRAESRGRR